MLAINFNFGKNPAEIREVFGIQVAIFNWFTAFFRYSTQEQIYFLIDQTEVWEEIRQAAAGAGLDEKRLVPLDRRFVQENFARFSTIFRPDPMAQQLFWQRTQVPGPGFNFCGLAHAIAGLETGELLEQYCLAPTEDTDAIICPSRAVQSAIRNFWDTYANYIKLRFGADFSCPVQLPVIPLGIHADQFFARTAPEKRAAQRRALGLNDNDIVLLWVGRLSHAIKAHPLAMFQAAERAAELTGASVHLVMVGYFTPEDAEPQFRNLVRDICKKAKVTFIASKDPRFPDGLWAAGDIFLSLTDNMQESFGLTPIEAMAAGLPRVISDWDGYRESVRAGEDGFLIRTVQPPPGSGNALSALLLSGKEMYGGFLAKTALSVAVDAEMAAQAIKVLIEDKNKRKDMGAKARARVREIYDWKNIIPAYENLWQEMAGKRQKVKAAAKPVVWPAVMPQVPDPFTMYAAYPSAALNETDRLYVTADAETIRMLWRHDINVFGLDIMIAPDDTTRLTALISSQNGISIGELVRKFPHLDRAALWRTIGWLIKLGVLAFKN